MSKHCRVSRSLLKPESSRCRLRVSCRLRAASRVPQRHNLSFPINPDPWSGSSGVETSDVVHHDFTLASFRPSSSLHKRSGGIHIVFARGLVLRPDEAGSVVTIRRVTLVHINPPSTDSVALCAVEFLPWHCGVDPLVFKRLHLQRPRLLHFYWVQLLLGYIVKGFTFRRILV